jgi:hypothetical protein
LFEHRINDHVCTCSANTSTGNQILISETYTSQLQMQEWH